MWDNPTTSPSHIGLSVGITHLLAVTGSQGRLLSTGL
ncbi:hypothetical protein LINPERHAP2_LOCUS43075 [Linum perenne]